MEVKLLGLLSLAVVTLMVSSAQAGRQLSWPPSYPFCNSKTPCPATAGTTWYYCQQGGARNGCKQVLPGSDGFSTKDCTKQCIYSADAPFFCPKTPPCPKTPGTNWYYCTEGGAVNGCSSQLFPRATCTKQCVFSAPPAVAATSEVPPPPENVTLNTPPPPYKNDTTVNTTAPPPPNSTTNTSSPGVAPAPEDQLPVCSERPACPNTAGTSWYYCQSGQAFNGCMEVLDSTDGGFSSYDCSKQCLMHNEVAPSYEDCEVTPPCPKTNGTSWYHCLKGGAVTGCSMQPFPDLDCSDQCLFSNPPAADTPAASYDECEITPPCPKTNGTSWFHCLKGLAIDGCGSNPFSASECSDQCLFSNPANSSSTNHTRPVPPPVAAAPDAPPPHNWTVWKKSPPPPKPSPRSPPPPKPPVVANTTEAPGECITTCLHNNNFFQLYDKFCNCKVCSGSKCCCQDPFVWSCYRIPGKKPRRTCFKQFIADDCSVTCDLP